MTTATNLIIKSIRRNEIARARFTCDLFSELLAKCDDWNCHGHPGSEHADLWGTCDHGADDAEWRVHLAFTNGANVTDEQIKKLRDEAIARPGGADDRTIGICNNALDGDDADREKAADMIRAAEIASLC